MSISVPSRIEELKEPDVTFACMLNLEAVLRGIEEANSMVALLRITGIQPRALSAYVKRSTRNDWFDDESAKITFLD